MMDWFVLLIPLALLPILLLFVFVGCELDRSGTGDSPIKFQYDPGLHEASNSDPGLGSIEWKYKLELEIDPEWGGPGIIGDTPGGTFVGPFVRSADNSTAILAKGETHLYFIQFASYGWVTCTCTVITKGNPPFDNQTETFELDDVKKKKNEDESGPAFQLSRDGSGFKLG